MRVPNMAVQQAEGGWQWHTQACVLIIKPLPDLLHLCGLEVFGNRPDLGGDISASGRHRCGIFWLGWFMDVGRYEGVAPSMWAFPGLILANEWELRHLCPKKAA